MQYFTFTLNDVNENGNFGSPPDSHTTVSLQGEVTLTTLCDYFAQFVRGCGYVLPENSTIGVVEEDF